ncbi:MAG: hypothetical protein OXU68_10730 [Bacteroidota bacterium]|nr:hypothetical protein [Bacteroidota bacterium]
MRLRKHAYAALLFAIPFLVGIGGGRTFFIYPRNHYGPSSTPAVNYPMLGQEIPSANLITPRNKGTHTRASMLDSFIAIL